MVGQVVAMRYDIEYATREFHYAEGVLKSLVCRPGIYKIRQGELMNIAQPLEGTRIENLTLVAVQPNERMDGISNLMQVFCHKQTLSLGLSQRRPITEMRLARGKRTR